MVAVVVDLRRIRHGKLRLIGGELVDPLLREVGHRHAGEVAPDLVGVAAAVGRLDQQRRRRVPGAARVRHRDEGRAFLARDDRRQAVRLLAHHQRALVIRRLDRLERATLS